MIDRSGGTRIFEGPEQGHFHAPALDPLAPFTPPFPLTTSSEEKCHGLFIIYTKVSIKILQQGFSKSNSYIDLLTRLQITNKKKKKSSGLVEVQRTPLF